MAGSREVATIEALLESGAIVGHKDGNHGSDYPRVEEFGSTGVPFLTAKSLGDGKVDIDSAPRLADIRADKLRLGFVKPGDVLLSHNATIGRVGIVPELHGRLLIGTSLTYFRLDQSRILPRYLAAYFTGADFQNQLAAVMSHTTRNQVPITAQRRLTIILPTLAEQRAIVDVLGALDDMIELSGRKSRTLEGMAQAIFQAWFMEFEPVKAKAAGAQSFSSMPQTIFDALPTVLVDSELGLVPESWSLGTMGDIGSPRREQVAPADAAEGTAYIGLEHMPRKSIALTGWGTANTVTSAKSRFYIGDVLFGKLRPYFHKVGVAPVDGVCSTDIVVITPKRSHSAAWLAMLTSSDKFVNHADRTSAGTKMPRTNWKDMANFPVVIPPEQMFIAFQEIVEPMLALIRQNILETRKLSALRDYLLPKLLSNEVRIRPMEKSVS